MLKIIDHSSGNDQQQKCPVSPNFFNKELLDFIAFVSPHDASNSSSKYPEISSRSSSKKFEIWDFPATIRSSYRNIAAFFMPFQKLDQAENLGSSGKSV
ncbi:MAG: hypothetical protein JXQ90_18530, partial [Cyclobacteriaceae bacterium]